MSLGSFFGFSPSRAEKDAVRIQAEQAAARIRNLTNLTNKVSDFYDPYSTTTQQQSIQGRQALGDMLGTIGNTRALPYERQVYQMDPNTIRDRSNIASQIAGQQYANADLNTRRQLGSRNVIAGSGNLNSALTGAGLAQARAQSSAGLKMFNDLNNLNDANSLRQKENIDNSNFNYYVNEQNRGLNDRLQLAEYLGSQPFANPAWDMEGNLANSTYDSNVGVANANANIHRSGRGSALLGQLVGIGGKKWLK